MKSCPTRSPGHILSTLEQRLTEAFARPFSVRGQLVDVKASIGLVAAGPEELGYGYCMYLQKSQHPASVAGR
jgi:hypothetical protein